MCSYHKTAPTRRRVIVKVMTSLYDPHFRFVHNGIVEDTRWKQASELKKDAWTYVSKVGETSISVAELDVSLFSNFSEIEISLLKIEISVLKLEMAYMSRNGFITGRMSIIF